MDHCRAALLAVYTTYRDLGSKSMQDADANVRDAVAPGLILGPRLVVATQTIVSAGAVESRTENGIGRHCCLLELMLLVALRVPESSAEENRGWSGCHEVLS